MSVLSAVWRVVDAALGIAIRIDVRNERKKLLRRLDQLGDASAQRLERTRAPTVVLPRPAPPTTPPAASGAASPTVPRTPPRRR